MKNASLKDWNSGKCKRTDREDLLLPIPNSPLHYLLPAKLSQQQQPQWQVTEGLVTAAEALMAVFTEKREREFEEILTL